MKSVVKYGRELHNLIMKILSTTLVILGVKLYLDRHNQSYKKLAKVMKQIMRII